MRCDARGDPERRELDLRERYGEHERRAGFVEHERDPATIVADGRQAARPTRAAERLAQGCASVCRRDLDGTADVRHDSATFVNDLRTSAARVISVGRNAAWIVFEDETEPRLAQLRKGDRHATTLIPGDLVDASPLDDDRVVVERVHPRSFVLERRTAGGRTKQMAANVDTLAIVAALAEPALHVAMVDRLIAFAEMHDVRSLLAFTKPDLVRTDPNLPATFGEDMVRLYRSLGYTAMLLQPRDGIGIEELRSEIATSRVLLVGNSGVGKSSIFGKLGGVSAVGELSRFGRGKQTTTSARLFRTGDGFLIDSPGVGEFMLEDMTPGRVTQLFVEMREPATHCRFADCKHTVEPVCGIRAALAAGTIAASRYRSYREIIAGTA